MVYCGTIVTDDGKEKKVNIDFEPFKPINTSLYLCDNKFHTEVGEKMHEHVWSNVAGGEEEVAWGMNLPLSVFPNPPIGGSCFNAIFHCKIYMRY